MTCDDVLDVLERLEDAGVAVWVDGGWGVDALVGRQTREHDDLDLALARDDLDRACRALAAAGFHYDDDADPGLPARCVLVDAQGREIDLHPLILDASGDGWQQLAVDAPTPPGLGAGWGRYPAEHMRKRGNIGGRVVRCVSAELQMLFHQGYTWGASDRHDVALLEGECGVEPRRLTRDRRFRP